MEKYIFELFVQDFILLAYSAIMDNMLNLDDYALGQRVQGVIWALSTTTVRSFIG